MCDPVTAVMAIGALAGAGASVYTGQQQAAATKKASAAATANADKTAREAERERNRVNARKPNVAGLIAANQQSAQSGASGTMLTGPSGVDPNTLSLGKNTLLGG